MTRLYRLVDGTAFRDEDDNPIAYDHTPATAATGPVFFIVEIEAHWTSDFLQSDFVVTRTPIYAERRDDGARDYAPFETTVPGAPTPYIGENTIAQEITRTPGWATRAHGTLGFDVPDEISSTGTIFASDFGYRSRADDAMGVRPYPPVLESAFSWDRLLSMNPAVSITSENYGSVSIINSDNRFDGIVASWNNDHRPVRILRGQKTLDDDRGILVDPPYSSLTEVLVGLQGPWELTEDTLEVPLSGAIDWLTRKLQGSLYAGTGTYEGTSDMEGRPKPKLRGSARELTPTLIDPPNQIYQLNDGPVTVSHLYVGGAETYDYEGDTDDLYVGDAMPGYWRSNNARGLIQLGSVPIRKVTCDATGAFPVAGFKTKLVDIARYLLSEDLTVPATYLNVSSFTAAATAFGYTGGWYWGSDDTSDGQTAVTQILSSLGAKLYENRQGEITCFVLRALTGSETPLGTLDASKIEKLIPGSLPSGLSPAPYLVRVAYEHCFTVQGTSEINTTSATTDEQKFLENPDRYKVSVSYPILNASLARYELDPIGGALALADDAQEVADDLAALVCRRTRIYSATVAVEIGVAYDIGDIVRLQFPVDDLHNGRLARIVGEQFRAGDDTIALQIFI